MSEQKRKPRYGLRIAIGFLSILFIAVCILVGMAYSTLSSGQKEVYHSPNEASGTATDATVLTPQGASENVPDLTALPPPTTDDVSASGIEQLDPEQAIAAIETKEDAPTENTSRPLDPTNRDSNQELDNLF